MSKEIKMLKIIKNADVYTPEYIGKKDVLITADKIGYIQDHIDIGKKVEIEILDAEGKILVPGFIDSHVHILGGGGEGGYKTRTPEIMLSDITRAGVTTVVGCLGTDSVTRTMSSLIAKARGLEEEGITCYAYTGSYQVPVKTLTGSIQEDLILIDKIIGVGEIAISDHRSSQPTIEEVKKVAAAARVGGILSRKAGIVNVHLGNGSRGISLLEKIAIDTEIPITQFLPTHVGRNHRLFKSAIEYAKKGGIVDITTSTMQQFSEKRECKSSEALKIMLNNGVSIKNISFSSDGQGSLPVFNENGEYIRLKVGKVVTLFTSFREAVKHEDISMEVALKTVTSNPARNLKLKNKGGIQVGKDADIILLNKDLEIDTVIAKGQIMIENKRIVVKGTFEN